MFKVTRLNIYNWKIVNYIQYAAPSNRGRGRSFSRYLFAYDVETQYRADRKSWTDVVQSTTNLAIHLYHLSIFKFISDNVGLLLVLGWFTCSAKSPGLNKGISVTSWNKNQRVGSWRILLEQQPRAIFLGWEDAHCGKTREDSILPNQFIIQWSCCCQTGWRFPKPVPIVVIFSWPPRPHPPSPAPVYHLQLRCIRYCSLARVPCAFITKVQTLGSQELEDLLIFYQRVLLLETC